MKRKLASLFMCAVLSGCGIEGLNNAKPLTRAEFDPISHTFKFYDTKDNDLSIKGLKAKTSTGAEGSVDEVTIRNNASDVRTANVQQLLGMAYEAQVNWQGASQLVTSLGQVLAEVMPYVPSSIAASALGHLKTGPSVSLPGGGGFNAGGTPAGVADALMKLAGTKVETQPAK